MRRQHLNRERRRLRRLMASKARSREPNTLVTSSKPLALRRPSHTLTSRTVRSRLVAPQPQRQISSSRARLASAAPATRTTRPVPQLMEQRSISISTRTTILGRFCSFRPNIDGFEDPGQAGAPLLAELPEVGVLILRPTTDDQRRFQKLNLNPNCISRGPTVVYVTVPKLSSS